MDDKLDEAIDRAVREMMAVEPRPGMRHRVRKRLEARRRIFTVPRIATVAAAAAVLLIVTMTTRSTRPAPETVSTDARPAAAPSTPSSRTPSITPTNPAPATTVVRHRPSDAPATPSRQVQAASIDAAILPDAAVRIAPIAAIDPIRVANLSETAMPLQVPIVTNEIRIVPIAVDPIDIPPLTEPR
jgi:hypothetical protein